MYYLCMYLTGNWRGGFRGRGRGRDFVVEEFVIDEEDILATAQEIDGGWKCHETVCRSSHHSVVLSRN